MERENPRERESTSDLQTAVASADLEKEFPHGTRRALRALVDTIEREMSRSSQPSDESAGPTNELRASWAKLVALLALGPAPAVRECPACHHVGMRNATRCGYCWTELPSLPGSANVPS